MASSEQVLQDKMAICRAPQEFGVNTPIAPPWTGDEGGETPFSEVDGYPTNSYTINHETTCNDAQDSALFPFYSTWNGLANTTNLVFPSNDGCVHALSIGPAASPLTPESLIEAYNITNRSQVQDDFPLDCIDPRFLCIPHPKDYTTTGTPHDFTLDTRSDLGIFPPTPAPVDAAHRDDNYITVTSTCRQLPLLSEAPAQRARPIRSRARNDHARTQNLSPRHKKRRAKALESLTEQALYHSLPTADREYFDRVVTNLRNGSYLASPQSLEPTVGSAAGRLLIEPHRLTGPGAATARESVYAVLVDRPSEGAYVCWICGETRTDRRLVRALDHVRGHFKHRPYHCLETHFDQNTESASPLPPVSGCGQSFTSAEALKDYQTKIKNKKHICDTCGKIYTNSANMKRHMRKEHSS